MVRYIGFEKGRRRGVRRVGFGNQTAKPVHAKADVHAVRSGRGGKHTHQGKAKGDDKNSAGQGVNINQSEGKSGKNPFVILWVIVVGLVVFANLRSALTHADSFAATIPMLGFACLFIWAVYMMVRNRARRKRQHQIGQD